jgi:hypothetical protein
LRTTICSPELWAQRLSPTGKRSPSKTQKELGQFNRKRIKFQNRTRLGEANVAERLPSEPEAKFKPRHH